MTRAERHALRRLVVAVEGPKFQGQGCPRDFAVLAAARDFVAVHQISRAGRADRIALGVGIAFTVVFILLHIAAFMGHFA